MNMSNEMIEYKESFITKIRKFFKKLFGRTIEKENDLQQISTEKTNEVKQDIKQNRFINEIKVDTKEVDKVIKKDNFLKEIDGNEEALNMLSIERLKKLEEYYDDIISENEKKIKKLKATA